MEVLVGPTFEIEVSPPSAAEAAYVVSQDEINSSSSPPPCIFLKEDDEIAIRRSSPIGAPDDSSDSSSSSIGAPDDSEDEEGEEVKSGLSCLDSLEETLPIKRGLSTHFTGKSKSFASLSDVLMNSSSVTVKDLEKAENPFNKRRRLIMANKWCRKASFYSFSNPKSMPLLTLINEEEHEQEVLHLEEEEDEEEEESQASPSSSSSEHELRLRNQPRVSKLQEKKFKKSFKSHSCFSLTDLQHEEFQ